MLKLNPIYYSERERSSAETTQIMQSMRYCPNFESFSSAHFREPILSVDLLECLPKDMKTTLEFDVETLCTRIKISHQNLSGFRPNFSFDKSYLNHRIIQSTIVQLYIYTQPTSSLICSLFSDMIRKWITIDIFAT